MNRPIIVDAMGSDSAPVPEILGTVEAKRRFGIEAVLAGDRIRLVREMDRLGCPDAVEMVHAPEAVAAADEPVEALRRKPGSSMRVALERLRERDAGAVVSAGNSGALVVAAVATLGRLSGAERPALMVELPSLTGPVLLADAGANVDCRPTHLLSFARLAERVARRTMGTAQPRIGLLCNGIENGKGNDLVRQGAGLLERTDLRFVGRVEPHTLVKGEVDVVVTDGFNGNLVLKTMEGAEHLIQALLRRAFQQSLLPAIGYWLFGRAIRRRLRPRLDYRERGGAPLLGVNGVVVAAHGRSGPRAICNAVARAAELARFDLTESLDPLPVQTGPAGSPRRRPSGFSATIRRLGARAPSGA